MYTVNFHTFSGFYCPRPGLQSTKPNASVSGKLAIEMAIVGAIGYSISAYIRHSSGIEYDRLSEVAGDRVSPVVRHRVTEKGKKCNLAVERLSLTFVVPIL